VIVKRGKREDARTKRKYEAKDKGQRGGERSGTDESAGIQYFERTWSRILGKRRGDECKRGRIKREDQAVRWGGKRGGRKISVRNSKTCPTIS